MSSLRERRHDDLWTAAAKALGIRASGAHSPFRPIETREDASSAIRECTLVLMLVGLVQLSLSWLAGVGTAFDVLVYMPLAVLVNRFNSRIAAGLLLLFSLGAVALAVAAPLLRVDARTDLIVLAVLLWASVRSVEATLAFRRKPRAATVPGHPIELRASDIVGGGQAVLAAGPRGSWGLLLAGGMFLVAVASAFLPRHSVETRRATAPAHSDPRVAPTPANNSISTTVGGERIVLSAPSGLIEPRQAEPEIARLAEGFVAPAMELLALFVSPKDVESFSHDRRFSPARYVMVQVVRQTAGSSISPQEFAAAKASDSAPLDTRRLQHLLGAGPSLSQWLEASSASPSSMTEVQGARVRSEGVLEQTDRSISMGAIAEINATPEGSPSRVVVTSLVLVKGRVLVAYTYGTYDKSDDVASTHETARQVVRNLVNENAS